MVTMEEEGEKASRIAAIVCNETLNISKYPAKKARTSQKKK